jgi:high-affinity iron transporter
MRIIRIQDNPSGPTQMLPRLLAVVLVALVVVYADAAETRPAADPQAILHLLDYVSVEYPQFVQFGKVVNQAEYIEQEEFSSQVAQMILELPANPKREALAKRAAELANMIRKKDEGAKVSALANVIQHDLIEAYSVAVTPKQAPDLGQAQALYAAHCLACHGVEGNGKGPLAAGLDPEPTNFRDPARQSARSVYALFNTISLGVAGTPMVGFQQLPAEDRWKLAFYISQFVATDDVRRQGASAWEKGEGRTLFTGLMPLVTMTPAEARAKGSSADAVLAWLRTNPGAVAGKVSPVAFSIQTMERSLAAWKEGHGEEAYQLAVTAYLEGFELAEGSIDDVDRDLRTRTEQAMMAYRNAVRDPVVASSSVPARYEAAVHLLNECQERLNARGVSPTANFVSSLIIILREGLEAILVLAAMAAFLTKTQRREGLPWLHGGWIIALLLGALTWVVSSKLISISGAQREVTEGLTALLSSAVLLYVGFWLHNKSSTAKWNTFIRSQMTGVTKEGSWLGVGLVSFLAVYREVFETVLFYEALWVQSDAAAKSAILAGLGTGVAVLVILSWLIIRFSVRLPLGIFFGASSALLAAMSVIFAGQGVAALQAAGKLPASAINFPTLPLLGIYPNMQGVALQILLLALIVGGWLYMRGQDRRV